MRLLLLLVPLALAAPEAPAPPAPTPPAPAGEAPAPAAPAAPETPPKTPAKPPVKPAAKTAVGGTKTASTNLPSKRATDPEVGQKWYEASCVQCHGPSGKGDGPIAGDVVGGVPDLSGKILQDQFEPHIDLILAGKGRMPAYSEVIERQDVRRILVYLTEVQSGRILPGKAGSNKPAEPKEEDEGN